METTSTPIQNQSTHDLFLRSAIEDLGYVHQAERFSFLMKHPEYIWKQASDLIEELSQYSTTPETARHPNVKKGYSILQSFFEKEKKLIIQHRLLISVYGSMRYDDPHSADYDIMILSESPMSHTTHSTVSNLWKKELDIAWRDIGKDGHITIADMETLQQYQHWIRTNDSKKLIPYCDRIGTTIRNASSIFNGYTGFSYDPQAVTHMQSHIRNIAESTPPIGASIAMALEETRDVRRKRRSQ